MAILNSPRRWWFLIISMAARLPLSMVPVIVLLGALESGVSVAQAGLLLGAVTLGSAVTGIFQGPAWDRLDRGWLYLALSLTSSLALALMSFLPLASLLALALGFTYGFLRPQTTIVARAIWLEELDDQPELAKRAIALDVSLIPVLGIIGPLLAGLLFALLGPQAFAAVAGIAALSGLFLSAVLRVLKAPTGNSSSLLASARTLFLSSPLLMALMLVLITTTATGAVTVLLAAHLEEIGNPEWLSPLLALSAVGVIVGSFLLRGLISTSRLAVLLIGELACFLLYALLFLAPPAYLWILLPLGSLFVAPLATVFYLLIDSRVPAQDRQAAFALLASGQVLGISLGQIIFSLLAEALGPTSAALAAAALLTVSLLIWLTGASGKRMLAAVPSPTSSGEDP